MHSDLEHARRNWERAIEIVSQLERGPGRETGGATRHEAERHVARLRAVIAQGRVMALERSHHAHMACEEAPASYLWSQVSGRGQGGRAL
ncbi:hypothetical protein F6X53_24335 [Methylobacterium soli]|uniref:Uncharacterized protein n=1 Tax=Methylobacterium soli TaxID=553447 RepID=A0A6L3SS32_9HYPH|nr:hypothetical protein F6X53_24335 [Methylobacterium soli]GJE45971.1 hypothetical protein AEGHOMDF_5171 [Methylobacterium soli]